MCASVNSWRASRNVLQRCVRLAGSGGPGAWRRHRGVLGRRNAVGPRRRCHRLCADADPNRNHREEENSKNADECPHVTALSAINSSADICITAQCGADSGGKDATLFSGKATRVSMAAASQP